jgi:hypothetical protein
MATVELGELTDRKGNRYQVVWDDYSGKLWAKYIPTGNHYHVGKADNPTEAVYKVQAWIASQ